MYFDCQKFENEIFLKNDNEKSFDELLKECKELKNIFEYFKNIENFLIK